jgi:hypothetical protein
MISTSQKSAVEVLATAGFCRFHLRSVVALTPTWAATHESPTPSR